MGHDWEWFTPILEMLEIEVCNIIYNPGNIGKRTFSMFWYPGNIGNLIFVEFWIFSKKDARRNFTQDAPVHGPRSLIWDRFRPEKLKLFQTPIFKWRRRRRRWRRRADNSPIWPDPWTITPREQISRSGSIPHFDLMEHTFFRRSNCRFKHQCVYRIWQILIIYTP